MSASRATALPFHYGWLIVAAGSLGIFACIGLARFALGMLLPAMAKDLHLSYAQMGTISTANFLGYLGGILITPRLVRHFGARALIASALLLSGSAMIAIGWSSRMLPLVTLYILTGIGSALANVPIMALLATWFTSKLRGKAAGFVVSGNGAAIVFAGLTVPWLNEHTGLQWRLSWIVLGLMVIIIALICLAVLRNRPQDIGLIAAGGENPARPAPLHQLSTKRAIPPRLILHCGAIYAIFGFTFVTYATFIVTTMVQQYGFSQQTAGQFWSWVGLFSLFSGPVFGSLADRVSRRFSLIIVFGFQTLAYLLAGLQPTVVLLYCSIGCFGVVAWSVPSVMAALSGDYAGPDKAFAFFSAITLLFAAGQVAGPFLAGQTAELYGSFAPSYLLAAALTTTAAILSFFLPNPDRKTSSHSS